MYHKILESQYNEIKTYVSHELNSNGYKTPKSIRDTYYKTFYIYVSDLVFSYIIEHKLLSDNMFDEYQDEVDNITQDIINDLSSDKYVNSNEIISHSHLDTIHKLDNILREPVELRSSITFIYKNNKYTGIPKLRLSNGNIIFYIDNQMKTFPINQLTIV